MSSWLALVLVDTIAVASFARCFTGPGELTAALATLLVVHLAGLAARGGASGLRAGSLRRADPIAGTDVGTASLGPGRGGRLARRGWWALAVVATVFLPIGIVLGSTFSWVVPGHATWHALDKDLTAAWRAFSYQLAPVTELPGLVLATAWAAGAAGLLAELISSRRKIPAIFSLAPALGLYLFSSALGTGSWRAVDLALIAGAACWYLVAVVREREAAQDVVIASPDAALSVGERAASYGAGAVMLRMAVLAAVAAAVIGPNLPGAGSQPLVAWHGKGGGGHVTKSTVIPGGDLPQGIEISTLVQVAEEEVDNPDVVLFTVHSVTATREIIATLDTFNGNRWSASSTNGLRAVSSFAPPISTDLHQPPAPVPDGVAQERLIQVFQVALLAGYNLPSWGVPLAVANAGQVTRDGPGGSLVSDTALEQGSIYAVSSQAPDPTSAQLAADSTENSDPTDVALPAPVPGRIVLLAHSLVAGATTAYQKALDLQDYLTSSRFHYKLPARTKSGGVVTPLPGYGNLLSFLFKTRTGYCQQFATAFAVLARIDGLPTRIAVGFLPGSSVGHDDWAVDGTDTHAWPQVRFASYGWIDFEPTPGATVVGSTQPVTKPPPSKPVVTPTTLGRAHNLHRPSPAGGRPVRPGLFQSSHHARRRGGSSAPWLLVVPVALLAWAGGVPLWRRLRLRRAQREPRAGVLAAWGEALRMLDLAGVRRRRAETYLELARRVGSTGVLSEEGELALRDLARLATTASYAASPPSKAGSRQALRDAKTVARSSRRRVARWQRVAAALDPRSLVA